MKVLWIGSPGLYTPLHRQSGGGYNGGGWVASVQKEIVKHGNLNLGISFCMDGQPEKVVQDGELGAEERVLLLHDVLFQQRGDLVAEERLVVLPDLPLHLHGTGPVQLLVSHHQLQLLLRHLHDPTGHL